MRKLMIAVLLIAATAAPAQTHATKNQSQDKLRFTLILSRHGVRSPLATASALGVRSSDAWPEWEVPLGILTPHGAQTIRQMGAYMRMDLVRKGLLPANGCPESNEIYLYADIDQRTVMSTRNTFAGLEPGCDPPPVHVVAAAAGVKETSCLPEQI